MSVGNFLKLVTPDLYNGTLPEQQSRPLRALVTEGLARGASLPQIAYVLATAHHETGRFLHTEEIASGEAYEGRTDLGNVEPGDGVRFKGRGFVQLTGRDNYTRMSPVTGVDLVADPDAAKLPEIACVITWHGMTEGTFTGKSLSDYIAPKKCDFRKARQIVNGMDKATEIAGYADTFLAALKEAGVKPTKAQPERSSPAKSRTIQFSAAAAVPAVGGAVNAALSAEWETLAVFGVILVVLVLLTKNRLGEWAEGYT